MRKISNASLEEKGRGLHPNRSPIPIRGHTQAEVLSGKVAVDPRIFAQVYSRIDERQGTDESRVLVDLIRALYLDRSVFYFESLERLEPTARELGLELVKAKLCGFFPPEAWEDAHRIATELNAQSSKKAHGVNVARPLPNEVNQFPSTGSSVEPAQRRDSHSTCEVPSAQMASAEKSRTHKRGSGTFDQSFDTLKYFLGAGAAAMVVGFFLFAAAWDEGVIKHNDQFAAAPQVTNAISPEPRPQTEEPARAAAVPAEAAQFAIEEPAEDQVALAAQADDFSLPQKDAPQNEAPAYEEDIAISPSAPATVDETEIAGRRSQDPGTANVSQPEAEPLADESSQQTPSAIEQPAEEPASEPATILSEQAPEDALPDQAAVAPSAVSRGDEPRADLPAEEQKIAISPPLIPEETVPSSPSPAPTVREATNNKNEVAITPASPQVAAPKKAISKARSTARSSPPREKAPTPPAASPEGVQQETDIIVNDSGSKTAETPADERPLEDREAPAKLEQPQASTPAVANTPADDSAPTLATTNALEPAKTTANRRFVERLLGFKPGERIPRIIPGRESDDPDFVKRLESAGGTAPPILTSKQVEQPDFIRRLERAEGTAKREDSSKARAD